MVCLQETKRETFDIAFIRKFCPPAFDEFEYLPSVGASGGILTIWKSAFFEGHLAFRNNFAVSVDFKSWHNNTEWLLTNVYGPCTREGKIEFTDWLKNIDMPDDIDWMIVGDFNLMRRPEDRNKLGGDVNEMFLFNEAISALRLVELPLQGRRYTWTNKQQDPLLERLDWFFTSNAWTLTYPNTMVWPLVMQTSDHVPCLIKTATTVPKGKIFRFENYWMQHPDFMQVVQHAWSLPVETQDVAKRISAKFKNLRRVLKAWQSTVSNLKVIITNVKLVLSFMEVLEECRDLSVQEWNFKTLLMEKLLSLLKQQRIYWKERGTIKWVKFGDEGTNFLMLTSL